MTDQTTIARDQDGLPDILQWIESELVDLVFDIEEVGSDTTDYRSFRLRGNYRGSLVGIDLLVAHDMKPGVVDDELDDTAFQQQGLIFVRRGPEYDALFAALAELYSLPLPIGGVRDSVPLTSFALEGDPSQLDEELLKFKVFHDIVEENTEDPNNAYFELFVDLDIPNRIACINEKDQEYRRGVLNALV